MTKTIFEIQKEITNLDKHLNIIKSVYDEIKEDSSLDVKKVKKYALKIEESEQEKTDLLQQIDKINKGKLIAIEYDGEYDWHSKTIIFPKGTSKQFKRNWLWKNQLPVFTECYHIDSPYDCTGKATCTNVEYIKNKVVLTTHLDL